VKENNGVKEGDPDYGSIAEARDVNEQGSQKKEELYNMVAGGALGNWKEGGGQTEEYDGKCVDQLYSAWKGKRGEGRVSHS